MDLYVDCPHCGDNFVEDSGFTGPGDTCQCLCGAKIKLDYELIVMSQTSTLLTAGDPNLDLNSMED